MVLVWIGVESRHCQGVFAFIKLLRGVCSFVMGWGRFVVQCMCRIKKFRVEV